MAAFPYTEAVTRARIAYKYANTMESLLRYCASGAMIVDDKTENDMRVMLDFVISQSRDTIAERGSDE